MIFCYVLKAFDGVERLSPEQSGTFNFIRQKDVFAVLPTVLGISLVVELAVEHAFFKPKPGELEHRFDLIYFLFLSLSTAPNYSCTALLKLPALSL